MSIRQTSPSPPGRRPHARPGRPQWTAAWLGLVVALTPPAVLAQAAGRAPAAEPDERSAERLKLTTSDGVPLAAWYYPAATPEAADDAPREKAPPAPVVVLLHELGGSHASVEPLAEALQARGIAVVAPDLRGHGATTGAEGGAALEARSLKKADFERMVVTGGGRVREQADTHGDVETVRTWIKEQAEAGTLDIDKLFVVGCGVGAAVGAHWTARDATWPDLASGPQGRQVRGLVLVSPAWTTNGFSISPALAAGEHVRRTLPLLVIAGAKDDDAVKLYDQLKKARPDRWNEKRAGRAAPTQAPRLGRGELPTLYLRQFDTDLSGDRLAAAGPTDLRGGSTPAAIIEAFIGAITAEER